MHRSQDALIAGIVAGLLTLTGCGAMLNGTTQTIDVHAADPKAQILMDGTVVGTGQARVTGSPSRPPVVYVQNEQGGVARFQAESSVSGAAIVLDALWCVTIIGVAAPISDALLGTFRGLDQPREPIVVPPTSSRVRRIEYATEPAPVAAMYRP